VTELWRVVPDGAREIPPGGVCPRCRSPHVHRSRSRSPFSRFARAVTPYRLFKCTGCGWRGWRYPEVSEGPLLALPPVPDRSPRSPRTRDGKRVYTPAEITRARSRRHVAAALVLAAVCCSGFLYCQEEPPTVEER
jgi:hypothetical protein